MKTLSREASNQIGSRKGIDDIGRFRVHKLESSHTYTLSASVSGCLNQHDGARARRHCRAKLQ